MTSNEITSARLENGGVTCKIRIPYADTDLMGHVYYANYLVYYEISRSEWMRAAGCTYSDLEKMGYGLAVAESHARYLGRVFYDDLIEVNTRAEIISKTRVKMSYELRRVGEEKLLADGYTVHAVLDMKTMRPVQAPSILLELINKVSQA